MPRTPRIRPVHLPPADFASREIPRTRDRPARWWRLHPSTLQPIFFSRSFANRFAIPSLGTLYLARDARSCLLEKYGDELYGARNLGRKPELSAADWRDRMLTSVGVPRIIVCDLTSPATLAACGVEMGTLAHPQLKFAQAWARTIMEHPAGFDGIAYASHFTHARCLALFNRRSLKLNLMQSWPLVSHPAGLELLNDFEIALV